MKVRLRQEAVAELSEAYEWYELKRQGLGDEFRRCVEIALEQLRRNPEIGPVVHGDLRRVLARRFPYAVFYQRSEQEIVVYAVFHCSRDPSAWRSRLDD